MSERMHYVNSCGLRPLRWLIGARSGCAERLTGAVIPPFVLTLLMLFAADSVAQHAMSVTRTGTRDTLLFVHENGFVGVGTTRPAVMHFPYKGAPFGARTGLARLSIVHSRANAPDGNYAGLSAFVMGNTVNTVNLVGLQGIAGGTNDTTIGVHGRAGGVGTVPSIGGFFEATGAGMGDNIGGYFSSRGLGANYGVWADADWTPAVFNRLQDDGALLSFRVRERERASISVHGDFVSYNNLTSSLLALMEEEIEHGMVVVTSGSAFVPGADGLAVPGITVATSRFANDPSVAGAYLSRLANSDPDAESAAVIMNGGRGRVWVIDTGRDLSPGDPLVTSHIPGHAMRDPGVFELGHVFATVLNPVAWTDAHDEIKGHRRARVDVVFQRTITNHRARRLEEEVEHLSDRLARVESLVRWLDIDEEVVEPDAGIPPDPLPNMDPDGN